MPSAYRMRMIVSTLLLLPALAIADIYRWTDDDGTVNFSQTAPTDRPSQQIVTPAPPAMNENAAAEVEQLIEAQQQRSQDQQQQRHEQQQAEQIRQQREENCRIARENLQLFMDNPNRRFMDSDGNFQRLSEDLRQQRMIELQQYIDNLCHP